VVVDVVVVVAVVVAAAAVDVNLYALVRSAVVFYLAGLVIVVVVVNATLKIVTAFVTPSLGLVESNNMVAIAVVAGLQMRPILSPVPEQESTNIHLR